MKKVLSRRVLGIIAFVVVQIVLLMILEHHRRKESVERYIAELAKQGIVLNASKLFPPSPPDGENAAMVLSDPKLRQALRSLDERVYIIPMKLVAPGRAQIAWRQDQPFSRSNKVTWEMMAEALVMHQATLLEIQKAAQKPHLNFKLNYQEGISAHSYHFSIMSDVRKCLEISATLKLRSSETTEAINDLAAELKLIHLWRAEPVLYSQRLGMVAERHGLDMVWELLQADGLENADLLRLQMMCEIPDGHKPIIRAIKSEMAFQVQWIESMRKNSELYLSARWRLGLHPLSTQTNTSSTNDFQRGGSGRFDRLSIRAVMGGIKTWCWRYYNSYSDEEISLKQMTKVLETIKALDEGIPANSLIPAMEDHFKQLVMSSILWGSDYAHEMFWISGRVVGTCIAIESQRRMTCVAIALKRYQLKHGEWPETLETLVPEYLAAVPLDPADGKPLRYARKPNNEFLLYALGENLMDDGGDPSHDKSDQHPNFLRGKDWVWPMPMNEVANN